jgi:hypothetical protein
MNELPPTVRLLLEEGVTKLSSVSSLNDLLRKGFYKDLRTQAEYSLEEWEYPTTPEPITGNFIVTPTGPLNPFSKSQKCNERGCRIESARAFAKSVGLYSEYALVPDVFSSLLYHYHGDNIANALFDEIVVLNELLPLISEGIVRFGRPGLRLCDHHLKENQDLVSQTAETLLRITRGSLHIRVLEGPTEFDFYEIQEPMLTNSDERLTTLFRVTKEESRKILRQYRRRAGGRLPKDAERYLKWYLEDEYRREVQEMLEAVNIARISRAQLTTGSRRDVLLLNYVEKPSSRNDIEHWEQMRTIELPWIKDLTIEEIIRLRDSAGPALERLRLLLTSRFKEAESSKPDIAGELESEALEIRAQMEAWKAGRGSQFEIYYGALGISLIVYGLAHDALLAAGTAIFTAIGNVFRDKKQESVELGKLKGKPGFALLRARDLLKHRKH